MFELTDLGRPSKIVRNEISQTENLVTITQKQYLLSILYKKRMENANPVSILLDSNIKLEPNPQGQENGKQQNAYTSLLGSLQYLSVVTRLDISFAVNKLAALLI